MGSLFYFKNVNCESYCCLFQALYAILNLIFPLALAILSLLSVFFFSIATGFTDFGIEKTAIGLLITTVSFYFVAVLLFGYTVCYQASFIRLVERNFALVPRRKVLSNMVYVRHLN